MSVIMDVNASASVRVIVHVTVNVTPNEQNMFGMWCEPKNNIFNSNENGN